MVEGGCLGLQLVTVPLHLAECAYTLKRLKQPLLRKSYSLPSRGGVFPPK
ncbi:unnamed protein product [Echinostoma caproni]|uniref:Uncharacterized protein n=1 Tax=Echinostoma caproni TaxID=27848 RepID=A0A183A4S5_9TREM|nr:unnamed protein product [Echinostoma caproni]